MKWVIRGDGDGARGRRHNGAARSSKSWWTGTRSRSNSCGSTALSPRCVFHRPDAAIRSPITTTANGSWRVAVGQREFDLGVMSPAEAVQVVSGVGESGPSRLTAPIPGKVVAVKVAPGDEVTPGQPLVVLEAMKMENELAAEQAGRVAAIHVRAATRSKAANCSWRSNSTGRERDEAGAFTAPESTVDSIHHRLPGNPNRRIAVYRSSFS